MPKVVNFLDTPEGQDIIEIAAEEIAKQREEQVFSLFETLLLLTGTPVDGKVPKPTRDQPIKPKK